ncbi:O-antigen ligase family protein [Thalassotalea sp. LPB0316]|uniref:O-antigen ligase family protein n=1 Tax=Thalassotalea sp. LPB0316 TaxID=2769490 RepID=UPI001866DD38|nr:O-antigen ligase family protein [Thalassotalea sp. LPB0316]QOL26574.1 O-antigen ligase family protein [Thalassotalea sp. LPB0316]
MTQLFYTQYYIPGVIATIVVVGFELSHLINNPVMYSTQTVRWMILFVFVALLLFDKRKYINFEQLRFVLLLGFITSTGYGLLKDIFHPAEFFHADAIARFAGGAGDPNNFGLLCLLLIFFYLPSVPKQPIKASQLVIVAGLLGAGALTVSRSFFLVSFFSLFLYFLLYFRAALGEIFFRALFGLSLAILAGIFVLLSGAMEHVNLDIMSRFDTDNLSDLTGARSDIAKEYFKMYLAQEPDFMLLGAGINGYLGYYNYYFGVDKIFEEVVGPHNTFLEMLVSVGIIGSFLFTYFVYAGFKAEKIRTQNFTFYRLSYLPIIVFLLYCLSLQNLGKYSSYFIVMMIIYNTYRKA